MAQRSAILFACTLLICSVGHTRADLGIENEFNAWLASDAGMTAVANGYYDPEDRVSGIQRFQLAKERIAELQAAHPSASFSLHTPFALMTLDEFRAYLSRSGSFPGKLSIQSPRLSNNSEPAIDWVTQSKCVPPVKDQGSCGSCWAFSVVGALESAYCLAGHNLTTLSEQQLVSCNRVQGGNDGCNGGLLTPAYDWIIKENKGGLCTEDAYPYTASDSKCKTTCKSESLGVKGYIELKAENEALDALKLHPLAIAVYADSEWQFYSSGIIEPVTFNINDLNHAVVLVGYGEDAGKTYWKIRNSWSHSWGEEGYIRVAVGHAFGFPTYPTF